MNDGITIISDNKDFEDTNRLITNVFHTELRLPDQVFKQNFSDFIFEEFDWAMSAEFWKIIQRLAIESQDSYILTAVLEPSPKDYFYREFGYYNWFKLSSNISSDDYWSVLGLEPESSSADAMLYNSDIVVWLSPSMKWAIWGERKYGICILATLDNRINLKSPFLESWRPVDEALTDLLSISFNNKYIPKEFSDPLRINYSSIPAK